MLFLSCCSCPGSWVSESAHGPFRSRISIPHSPVVPQDTTPIGFQSQMFRGFASAVQVWRAGCQCGESSHPPSRISVTVRSLPVVSLHARGRVFGATVSFPLPPMLMWLFYSLLWSSCPAIQVLLRGSCFRYNSSFPGLVSRGQQRVVEQGLTEKAWASLSCPSLWR